MEFYRDKEEAWKRRITTSLDRSEEEATAALERYIKVHSELPEPAQHLGRFEVFSTITLAHPSTLFRAACCPDKDLFVVVSRSGGGDRVSLWKMQGSKRWEVDANKGVSPDERVVSLVWDPSGRHIMVAHNPPRLTLHSLETGREQHNIDIPLIPAVTISDLWWLELSDKTFKNHAFPNFLGRNGIDPGSAHSLINHLPPLDFIPHESDLSSTELFVPGNSSHQPAHLERSDEFEEWPTLLGDLPSSRLKSKEVKDNTYGKQWGEANKCSTMLIVADSSGCMHYYLDGTFYLGKVQLTPVPSASCWSGHSAPSQQFLLHCGVASQTRSPLFQDTLICPTRIILPLLNDSGEFNSIARTSSTLRHLLWHCRKLAAELQVQWIGTESKEGAGGLGPKWLKSIEIVQRDNWGYADRRGVLELTLLLVTGQASQPLSSILAGGESTSDRKLTRWETAVGETLVKIRDFTERRLHPAFQRVYLLLEEVVSWISTPGKYSGLAFSMSETLELLNLVEAGVYLSSWLAATARDELNQFRNFVQWLRFETQRIQTAGSEANPSLVPKHDPLEVNRYLMSGLVKSEVDSWFEGPPPDERMLDFFRGRVTPLQSTVSDAEAFINSGRVLPAIEDADQSGINFRRNLLPLIDLIISQCSTRFQRTALSITDSAICNILPSATEIQKMGKMSAPKYIIKDQIIQNFKEKRQCCPLEEYFVAYIPSDTAANLLCVFNVKYSDDNAKNPVSSIMVSMNACVPKYMDATLHQYEILGFEILNDESLVIVKRHMKRCAEGSRPYLALVAWKDSSMKFERLRIEDSVSRSSTREDVVEIAVHLMKQTQLSVKPLPLSRIHELSSLSRKGPITLACNGKKRVACVLDEKGVVESLDLSTEPEEFVFYNDLDESMRDEDLASGSK